MAKIENDKYYTPKGLAEYIVNKTKEVIGEENITEYLEPSAGGGVFLDYLDKPYLAYDIIPEDDRVLKQDYLTLDLGYKKGMCVIGNPPFGRCNNLTTAFYKKAITEADYISFILPISQLDNNYKLYEFDLIHSENLGFKTYSGIDLLCCFNIYKRPNNNKLNNKPNYNLLDVTILEFTRGRNEKDIKQYDFGMCTWGNGSCGKEVDYVGQYAQEHYIIINNELHRDKILKVLKVTDWRHLYPSVSSAKLQTWKIYKHLKEQIPELR